MKRFIFTVLFALTLTGAPAFAQDTPEPTAIVDVTPTPDAPVEEPPIEELPDGVLDSALSRQEIIIGGLIFLVIAVLSLFSGVVVVSLRQAYDAVPRWMAEPIKEAVYGGLDRVKEETSRTPNVIDDALEAKLREIATEVFERQMTQAYRERNKG